MVVWWFPVTVIILLLWLFRRSLGFKGSESQEDVLERKIQRILVYGGETASASVIGIEQIGFDGTLLCPKLRFHLLVSPTGLEPFSAVAIRAINQVDIPLVQAGCMVEVRYRLEDPSVVAVMLHGRGSTL